MMPNIRKRVGDHRDIGKEAQNAVADDHEDHDRDERHDRRDGAGADGILAEARADGALLDDGEVGGQVRRHASSTERFCALSTVKLPSMRPEPPRIASRMTGAVMYLSSSTTAKRRPTFTCVTSAKIRAAARVEAEGDDRFAGLLMKRRLRIGEVVAGQKRAQFDHHGRLSPAVD